MPPAGRPKIVDAPDHPVLSKPWSYFVSGVHADFDPESQLHNTLILILSRGVSRVHLRFEGVHELEIDAGFPYMNMCLQILDVADMQWDGIKVRVQGFEPSSGIRFWARAVTQINT
jgi:hypothetical protein